MGKNMSSIVEKHLGDLRNFSVGVNNGRIDINIVYDDEYDLKFEYSFGFDKDSKETYFGGNMSRNLMYKIKSDRNEEFENSLMEQFIG